MWFGVEGCEGVWFGVEGCEGVWFGAEGYERLRCQPWRRSSADVRSVCGGWGLEFRVYRGTLLIKKSSPLGTCSSICLGPCGGPRGGALSHERGTP